MESKIVRIARLQPTRVLLLCATIVTAMFTPPVDAFAQAFTPQSVCNDPLSAAEAGIHNRLGAYHAVDLHMRVIRHKLSRQQSFDQDGLANLHARVSDVINNVHDLLPLTGQPNDLTVLARHLRDGTLAPTEGESNDEVVGILLLKGLEQKQPGATDGIARFLDALARFDHDLQALRAEPQDAAETITEAFGQALLEYYARDFGPVIKSTLQASETPHLLAVALSEVCDDTPNTAHVSMLANRPRANFCNNDSDIFMLYQRERRGQLLLLDTYTTSFLQQMDSFVIRDASGTDLQVHAPHLAVRAAALREMLEPLLPTLYDKDPGRFAKSLRLAQETVPAEPSNYQLLDRALLRGIAAQTFGQPHALARFIDKLTAVESALVRWSGSDDGTGFTALRIHVSELRSLYLDVVYPAARFMLNDTQAGVVQLRSQMAGTCGGSGHVGGSE